MHTTLAAFTNTFPLTSHRHYEASILNGRVSRTRKHVRMETSPSSPSPRLAEFLRRTEEGNPLQGLEKAEAAFSALKARSREPADVPKIVTVSEEPQLDMTEPKIDFDVVIAGGTLGILYATALQKRGWRVAVIERGRVQGRTQEWNISRDELSSLVANNIVSQKQLTETIVTECKAKGRLGFVARDGEMRQLGVPDVLNVGVAPDILVKHAVGNFIASEGTVLDRQNLINVVVAPDCVRLTLRQARPPTVSGALGAGGTGVGAKEDTSNNNEAGNRETVVTARMLIDAMGVFSPIAEQVRGGRAPDGVCITVGACATANWPENLHAPDVMLSRSPIDAQRSAQYFWEAFPLGRDSNARTTYMFSYGVANEKRQTLTEALEDYIDAVERYQHVSVDRYDSVKRVLFGFFPSYYKTSPTDIAFDRILPVGDAGGLQSPISFGGFGCCVRHLPRICAAVDEALRGTGATGNWSEDELLRRRHLQMIQWYLPSLSVTGLFHKAMSVEPGSKTAGPLLDEFGINDLLWTNMKSMENAGHVVQETFLRDVVTAGGLSKTLAIMTLRNPALAVRVSAFIGLPELIGWTRHYIALVGYAAALPVVRAMRDWAVKSGAVKGKTKFWLNRMVDGLTYGSGADVLHRID